MTPDDITRLADEIMEQSVAGWTHGRYELSMKLRTLAQQGKAGGVYCYVAGLESATVDGWIHAKVVSEGEFTTPRYAAPPANPPEAGVTDEMAWDALCSQAPHEAGHSHEHDEEAMLIDIMGLGRPEHHERALRIMKHALSLAIAPQPKDATT